MTAAGLINDLAEAQQRNLQSRPLQRWTRYDLIMLGEVGYATFAQVGAERATLIIMTNLPFSEWTQVFPRARLCKALPDRITDRARILYFACQSIRVDRSRIIRVE